MLIKAVRAFYGDEKGVKAGAVIDVNDLRGKQLIQSGLAEAAGGEKAAPAHANKMSAAAKAKAHAKTTD